MRNLLFCALLVLVPTTVSALFVMPPALSTVANSHIEHKLNAFLAADNARGFTEWLKKENIDVNTVVGEHSTSLLHLTTRSGKVLFVHQLLEAGAEVEIADSLGRTPLDAAEFWDHPAVIARLLAASAMPVDIAEAEGLGDAEALRVRRLVYDHLMPQVHPKLTPRVNYLTVCSNWLLRCLVSRPLFTPREQFERLHRNVRGRTLLQEAVAQGKAAIVKLLLSGRNYRRILYEEDERGWQAVHHAAFYGRKAELEMFLAKGADINAVVYSSSHTPLTLAALMGSATTVQRLLEMGANPARRDHLGMDALQLAVLGMHIETVEVLLQLGLSEGTIEAAHKLAVERNSTRSGYAKLLELLDNAPRRAPAVLNEQGFTELQQAVWDLDMPRVKAILLRDRSLLHEPERDGWTVAHHAAYLGYTDLMELLYSAGADFKAVGPGGFTPALLAAEEGNFAALAFLIKIDADISETTDASQNLLHLAVEGGHAYLVNWLVRKGANLRLRTNAGESALDIAKRLANRKLIDFLDRTEIGFYKDTGEFYIGPADQD